MHSAIDALSHFFPVLSKASIIVGIPANDLLRGFGSHCSHCYRLKWISYGAVLFQQQVTEFVEWYTSVSSYSILSYNSTFIVLRHIFGAPFFNFIENFDDFLSVPVFIKQKNKIIQTLYRINYGFWDLKR